MLSAIDTVDRAARLRVGLPHSTTLTRVRKNAITGLIRDKSRTNPRCPRPPIPCYDCTVVPAFDCMEYLLEFHLENTCESSMIHRSNSFLTTMLKHY